MLPATIVFLVVTVPDNRKMPPPNRLAELPLMVVLVIVSTSSPE